MPGNGESIRQASITQAFSSYHNCTHIFWQAIALLQNNLVLPEFKAGHCREI
ncbi:hypothetical protein [Iningainema tapete]|uniref:Uncharacterized protein n=1 Tax=Iningainema tapete BLCC-T55 TaxID=2748662 RepID=A0A8J6XIJ7_9CYAN|nr:hypothetical protein [Iningainema tapete]MBD2776634.1 hypothetical protein [Iningainema tapete BLCC-T55]